MNKFFVAAVFAATAFAMPAAMQVQAAPVPAKCAFLPLLPDCVEAWSASAAASTKKVAAIATAAGKPKIKVVKCEKSENPKYILDCTYE